MEKKKFPYRNKKTITAEFVLLLFSVFGVIIFGYIIHENFHKWDFRDMKKNNEKLCYLSFSDYTPAYYSFEYYNETKFNEIRKYTEVKATFLELIILVIYIFCLVIYMNERNKMGEELYEKQNKRN